jgi:hypothetical protein
VLPLVLDDLQDVRAVDVVIVGEQPKVNLRGVRGVRGVRGAPEWRVAG